MTRPGRHPPPVTLTHPVHSSHRVLAPRSHLSPLSHTHTLSLTHTHTGSQAASWPTNQSFTTWYMNKYTQFWLTFPSSDPSLPSSSLTSPIGGTGAYCVAVNLSEYERHIKLKMEKSSEPVSHDDSSPPGKHSHRALLERPELGQWSIRLLISRSQEPLNYKCPSLDTSVSLQSRINLRHPTYDGLFFLIRGLYFLLQTNLCTSASAGIFLCFTKCTGVTITAGKTNVFHTSHSSTSRWTLKG